MATISGKFVNDSGQTVFEGTFVTDGAFDVTTPDVGSTATADSITIQAGDSATPGSGSGGDVIIQPGTGDTKGEVVIKDEAGTAQVEVDHGRARVGATGGNLGFFGSGGTPQPAAPVVLGDVITALQALGLVAT